MLADNRELYTCEYCQRNPYFYSALGHDGEPQGYWPNNLATGEPLARCPMRDVLATDPAVIAEVSIQRTELYPLYRAGHLAEAGGVLDQPARYLAFMRFFDTTRERTQAAYDDEQAKDADNVHPDGLT